jgi:F0F1-type ATP synthase epsilon subunit
MNTDIFHLQLVGREGIIYEGEAASITSYNEVGKFDILSQHANFISLINKEIVIIGKDGTQKKFSFDNALIKVFENNVKVYLGIEGIINLPKTPSSTEKQGL